MKTTFVCEKSRPLDIVLFSFFNKSSNMFIVEIASQVHFHRSALRIISNQQKM